MKKTMVLFLAALFSAMFPSSGRAVIATASSNQEAGVTPQQAVDGNMQTRWSSVFSDPQWLLIDLQSSREIVGLTLHWETAFGKSYDILVSQNNANWTKVYSTDNGDGSIDDIYFGKRTCRYIKLVLRERGTPWGYSFWEVSLKGPEDEISITTSGELKGIAENIFDGNSKTSANIPESAGAFLQLAFKKGLSCAAVNVAWGADYPTAYLMQVSNDGKTWRAAYDQKNGKGGAETVSANMVGARFLKLEFKKSNKGKGYSIAEISFKDWKELSMRSGLDMKRSVVGDECYEWVTFVGCDGTFTPEQYPYQVSFWIGDEKEKQVYTPETMQTDWKLKEGRLPVSVVEWEQNGIKSESTVFAKKIKALNRLITFSRVTVKNTGNADRELCLYLVIRRSPLAGKWNASLNNVVYDGANMIRVNGKSALYLKEKPVSGYKLETWIGRLVSLKTLESGVNIPINNNNELGAVAVYKFTLKPGQERSYDFLAASNEPGEMSAQTFSQLDYKTNLAETENFWKNRTSMEFEVPDKVYSDCFYSSLYYLLIMMKGDALMCPGSYSYKSYFQHDAIEMVGALDKAGLHDLAARASNHFGVKAFAGPDEDRYGDELGGAVFGWYEHYRVTKDVNYLRRVFPMMLTGCEYIRQLRARQMTPEFKNTAFYGLMPKSQSQDNWNHHAYLYVDDWWAIMGLKATADAAKIIGAANAGWVASEYESLLKCTLDSARKVMAQEKLDFMTGFADYWPKNMHIVDAEHRILGDTQMAWAHRSAIFPGLSLGIQIPMDLFRNTYKKYWERAGKFSGYDGAWYVEYEGFFWGYNVQLAIPMMYLDMEDVTLKNIEWSVKNQNCPGGWCEGMYTRINSKGLREIADGVVIGDSPHGWTAAYYIHLLRNMVFREEFDKLILLGCIPKTWLENGKKISVKNAPTYFGMLNLEVTTDGKNRQIKTVIDLKSPPKGGYVLNLPEGLTILGVEVDGAKIDTFNPRSVDLPPAAKTVTIKY
ncbi:MAG: discoidin domain-containing protein [Elusimicrobiota bacterium]